MPPKKATNWKENDKVESAGHDDGKAAVDQSETKSDSRSSGKTSRKRSKDDIDYDYDKGNTSLRRFISHYADSSNLTRFSTAPFFLNPYALICVLS